MTYRLTTLLYLFAVVAASLSVFGTVGLFVVALLGLFWTALISAPRPRTPFPWVSWPEVFTILIVIGILAALLLPAVQSPYPASRRNQSLNNVKQLTLAIHNYHDTLGHFPPPYVTDDEGNPLYSWRVAILPYMEGDTLHKKFKLDEPWDSPHNRKLLIDVDGYQSPRLGVDEKIAGETHYLAVVGPETVWDPDATTTLRDVTDGTSNTMFLLEVGGRGIHWSEPRDLTIDEAVDLLTGKSTERYYTIKKGYFISKKYAHDGLDVRIVAWLDGHATGQDVLKNPADARALLTKSGGEDVTDVEEYRYDEYDPERHLIEVIIHWGRIWGICVWLVVVLLPAIPAARKKIWPMPIEDKNNEEANPHSTSI